MTQAEKDLLLQDLCARLPYGVKLKKLTKADSDIADIGAAVKLYSINIERYCDIRFYTYEGKALTVCEEGRLFRPGYFLRYKPYLFPMSSMTEEQKEIYCQLQQKVIYNSKGVVNKDVMNYLNWCYENHLDVNDLIPMDLAIDATGLNVY